VHPTDTLVYVKVYPMDVKGIVVYSIGINDTWWVMDFHMEVYNV